MDATLAGIQSKFNIEEMETHCCYDILCTHIPDDLFGKTPSMCTVLIAAPITVVVHQSTVGVCAQFKYLSHHHLILYSICQSDPQFIPSDSISCVSLMYGHTLWTICLDS